MNKADKLTAKFWDKLRRAAGVEIVYVRDDISRPLRIIREEASPQGMIVLASVKHFKEVRTYLIVAAELPFLPSVGDVILDGARRYEIFAGASEPATSISPCRLPVPKRPHPSRRPQPAFTTPRKSPPSLPLSSSCRRIFRR